MAEDLTYERRLDGLVAVHVLGWHLVQCELGDYLADSVGEIRRRVISWSPTTDGNNMLAVIEAMQKREFKLLLEWLPRRGSYITPGGAHDRPVPLWSCLFYTGVALHGGPAYVRSQANADTAPMAVVLAALAAFGIEVPADEQS